MCVWLCFTLPGLGRSHCLFCTERIASLRSVSWKFRELRASVTLCVCHPNLKCICRMRWACYLNLWRRLQVQAFVFKHCFESANAASCVNDLSTQLSSLLDHRNTAALLFLYKFLHGLIDSSEALYRVSHVRMSRLSFCLHVPGSDPQKALRVVIEYGQCDFYWALFITTHWTATRATESEISDKRRHSASSLAASWCRKTVC